MKYVGCFRIHFTILGIAGIWMPRSFENNVRLKFYYSVYRIFFLTLFLVGIVYTQFRFFILVIGDIEKTVDSSVLFFTILPHIIKIYTLISCRERIIRLLDIIERIPDKNNILQMFSKNVALISSAYFCTCIGTAILWCVYPFMKPVLTLPFYYPYISQESFLFPVLYVYQTFGIIISALTIASEDFLAGGLMALAAAQLELLCCDLSTIGENKENINGNIDQYYEKIVTCIKFHAKIISFVKELSTIYGLSVFGQFLFSGILLCESAFIIITSDVFTESVTMFLYLLCLLGQLLLYCFCGNMIKTNSDKVAAAAYSSRWEMTSLPTQKALLFLIMRSQMTLTVTPGGIFDLSLVTFSAVLKSSYSFLAVLNQKHNS
uniref:Odorant receptor n=1 Tax=Streltzoviella insularis TaxID=1206366 RepID=A0A7D5UMN3_9NEOP|nr:odorant receptor 8 [Streltzoviella insularis]